jgi:DNA-binding transcriptional LysR family regulator
LLVAQHHSFARAAEALFITPSGLSLLIRELETHLGFRLFDRTTRHVALTTHGSELHTVARRSLQELDAAMSRLGRSSRDASQTISIGAAALISANILAPAIREFRGQRPDLKIELYDGPQPTLMQRVEAGQLDLALGVFNRAPGVRRTPFFRFTFMVIRPEDQSVSRRASITWSALKDETLITMPAESPLQQIIDRYLAKVGIPLEGRVVQNLLDTVIAMVEAGHGIAVIPSFGLPACRNRRVVMSRLINPVVSLDFHQIHNRGRKLPSGAEDFTVFLKGYIARWAGRAGIL